MADVTTEIRTEHISGVLKETCGLPELKVRFYLYHDRQRQTEAWWAAQT
jgi:hypothetical protein